MKSLQIVVGAFAVACLLGCNESNQSGSPSGTKPGASAMGTVDHVNTGMNVRDRSDATKTPLDQNENQADVNTTAEIRKRLVATSMSVDAQNAKIVTQSGRVTLRGPVKSAEEKKQIEEIAVSIAGAGKVDNQLEIKSNP